MSSSPLILPNSQKTTLEKNMTALFARYPHERQRLTFILSQPAPKFPLINIAVPPAPSRPPIRILLLCGISNPVFVAHLLNDERVKKENFKLFIFEQDPEFLAFCFQNIDMTQLIASERTEWFLLNTQQSVKAALFRALKPEGVTAMMLNVQVLEVVSPKSEDISAFYQELGPIYNETAHHILHNHGNLKDSLLGVEVTVRNKDYLLNNPGVADLKGAYQGCNALLVGAGPSLDANIEAIKKHNDKFVIIAADAALKPLLAAGIKVHYVTSIERLNAYQIPFFTDLEKVDADLVAFPVLHPDVLALYPGTVRMVYRNYGFYAYFQKAYPKGILRCGGSTSHLGLRLADYLGCRRTFFVGLDSTYEEKDGLYRSHCSGTGHPKWGAFLPIETFSQKYNHMPPMQALNNLGQPAMTNITYYQWCKEFSEELAYVGQRMSITNCSATGLAMEGIKYLPLDEAAANLDPLTVEKPVPPPVTFNRSWDNSELIKNFKAWNQMAVEGIAESDRLLALDTITNEEFQGLLYLYNFRMVIDDLFVSFVIQCCAHDFFILENRWYSYDQDLEVDMKEKIQVIKQRMELFINTLTQLTDIFEEKKSV